MRGKIRPRMSLGKNVFRSHSWPVFGEIEIGETRGVVATRGVTSLRCGAWWVVMRARFVGSEEGFSRFADDQGSVEEGDEGSSGFEALDDLLDEGGTGCGLGSEVRCDAPLATEEKVHRGRVGREPFGRTCEFLAIELGHERTQFLRGEEPAQLFMVQFDMSADGEELFALGHIDSRGDDDLIGADVEVEAAA